MTSGYLYMAFALLGFSALGVLHKLADTFDCHPRAVNALLAATSLLLTAAILAVRGQPLSAPSEVWTIAVPFGISASIAILAFQAGIRYGSIATSWLAINLSAGIPTVASILYYSEHVTPVRAAALGLIPVSLILLWKDKREQERSVKTVAPAAGLGEATRP